MHAGKEAEHLDAVEGVWCAALYVDNLLTPPRTMLFLRKNAGKEAEHLEAALGIPVLRHREKKPAGGSEDMERHFGCGWGGVRGSIAAIVGACYSAGGHVDAVFLRTPLPPLGSLLLLPCLGCTSTC